MPKTISFVSEKGGVGKTTLALQTAGLLDQLGKSVVVIDADSQGSCRDFASISESKSKFEVLEATTAKTLRSQIAMMISNIDYIIIDGARRTGEITGVAINVSDLVLLPLQPSALDIWATDGLVDDIRKCQELLNKPLAYYVINRAKKNTVIGREVQKILDDKELPCLEIVINDRQVYKRSLSEGLLVTDIEKSKDDPGYFEISMLAKRIENIVGE